MRALPSAISLSSVMRALRSDGLSNAPIASSRGRKSATVRGSGSPR